MTDALQGDLPAALDAPLSSFTVADNISMAYYSSQEPEVSERPVVLLHSVNAAPSAMEMKPVFESLRHKRVVYAPDLPGFGQSQRGELPYSPSFYARCVADFIKQIPGPAPDVIAFSLSCEFLVRAIVDLKLQVRSVTLISPTGLSDRPLPSAKASARINRVVTLPGLGSALYKGLTSRPSIRYFLGMAFPGKPPGELVDYAWQTSHRPGAQSAPFAFLSMKLFSENAMENLYAKVEAPMLLLFDQDPNVNFARTPELLAVKQNAKHPSIGQSRGMPQWEQPKRVNDTICRFYDELSAA